MRGLRQMKPTNGPSPGKPKEASKSMPPNRHPQKQKTEWHIHRENEAKERLIYHRDAEQRTPSGKRQAGSSSRPDALALEDQPT